MRAAGLAACGFRVQRLEVLLSNRQCRIDGDHGLDSPGSRFRVWASSFEAWGFEHSWKKRERGEEPQSATGRLQLSAGPVEAELQMPACNAYLVRQCVCAEIFPRNYF